MLSLKSWFKGKQNSSPVEFAEQNLKLLLQKSGFALSFKVKQKEEDIIIDLFGEDEGFLKAREGRLLLALQFYLNRVLQHRFFSQQDESFVLHLDSRGFLTQKEEKLLFLASRLRKKALSTGQPVWFKKALSPVQRRKIHRLLAERGDVKTSSVGDGFYKKICISPLPGALTSSEGFFE